MNKFEEKYCQQIAKLNLLFVSNFSEDFCRKVSSPITEIIFNYLKDNSQGFREYLKEVDPDETI